jgi:hypothetical protein
MFLIANTAYPSKSPMPLAAIIMRARKSKAELQRNAETLKKDQNSDMTEMVKPKDTHYSPQQAGPESKPTHDALEDFFIKTNMSTPEQQTEYYNKLKENLDLLNEENIKTEQGKSDVYRRAVEKTQLELILKQELQQKLKDEGQVKQEMGDSGESSGNTDA